MFLTIQICIGVIGSCMLGQWCYYGGVVLVAVVLVPGSACVLIVDLEEWKSLCRC